MDKQRGRSLPPHVSRVGLIGYRAFSDGASRLLYFAMLVLAARRLSPDQFGLIALASTVGWLVGVITDFGAQLFVSREVARRPSYAAAVVWPWFARRASAAVAVWLLVVFVALVTLPAATLVPFVILVLAHLSLAVTEFLYYVFRGMSRSDLESTLAIGQRITAFAFVAAGLFWTASFEMFAVAVFVPAIGVLAVAVWLTARLMERTDPLALSSPSEPGRHLVGALPSQAGTPHTSPVAVDPPALRAIWTLGVGMVLSALYFRIDILFVGYFAGTEGAAHYGAVFRLVDAIRLLPAATLAVMFPLLCVARTLTLLMRLAGALALVGVVVASVTSVAASPIVVAAYSEAYRPAVPVLQVLALAVPLFFVNFALTHQLVAWDAQRAYAALSAGALLVNIAGNASLVPRLGAVGAAWTTVVTEVCVTVGCCAGIWLASARRRGLDWQVAS